MTAVARRKSAAAGAGPVFSKTAQAKIRRILKRYPPEQKRSAVIPVLWLAQEEFGGWLSVEVMELVARTLGLPYIRVYEIATFYTMFNLEPVGKHHVQVCTNCSCMIRGSEAVLKSIREAAGLKKGEKTSADNLFTVSEVECLGACVAAPMMQVGRHYYTHLTAERAAQLIGEMKAGKMPTPDTTPGHSDPIHNGEYEEKP